MQCRPKVMGGQALRSECKLVAAYEGRCGALSTSSGAAGVARPLLRCLALSARSLSSAPPRIAYLGRGRRSHSGASIDVSAACSY
jgi:hypothetical protein